MSSLMMRLVKIYQKKCGKFYHGMRSGMEDVMEYLSHKSPWPIKKRLSTFQYNLAKLFQLKGTVIQIEKNSDK